MKSLILIVTATLLIAGCTDQGKAKDEVRRLLNDPESARFSQLTPGKQSGDTCGLVNARNRMGGYVGDTPFFFEKSSGTTAIVKSPDDNDFRMLWLGIRSNNFSDDLGRLIAQCAMVEKWAAVCSAPLNHAKHRMCSHMHEDGKALYHALRVAYDN